MIRTWKDGSSARYMWRRASALPGNFITWSREYRPIRTGGTGSGRCSLHQLERSMIAGLSNSARAVPGASFISMARSEEHTSELQSRENLVCRLLLEKKKEERNQ